MTQLKKQLVTYQILQDAEPSDMPAITLEQEPAPPAKTYTHNDCGNAERFLDIYGEDVRYCTAEKQWYVFDGVCWKPDHTSQIEKMAQAAVDASYEAEIAELRQMEESDVQKALLASASKRRTAAGNLKSLRSYVDMAALRATITPEEFDSDIYELHTQNGSMNLRDFNGYLYHKKDFFFTKTAGAAFPVDESMDGADLKLNCPNWTKFVLQCSYGDVELYNYLQKAAGYSVITGDISEQKVFCLVGQGRNGKSLFINMLAEIAGDYACKIESSVLSMTRRGDRDADTSKELYRMRGSRFVYANEFSRNSVLNETFLKAITDGGKISCRQLYNAAIEYTPTYKLWFSTNHLPNLQAMDEGIRRRLVVIPFRLALAPEAVNKNLAETLRQEADHILLWLLYGYWKYTQEGLEPPEAVRQASAAYFGEQDVYQTFLQERYEADVNGKVYAKELYQDYRWWCGDNGERGVSNIVFGKELQRLGLQKDKDRYGIFYSLKKKSLDA